MYLGVSFLFVSTPSPCGHSPYILLRKTQGEKVRCISLSPLLCPVALRGISFLYRRYLKLLLCVVPVIGEVSRREGGVKTTSHQSVYTPSPLPCPVALRGIALEI